MEFTLSLSAEEIARNASAAKLEPQMSVEIFEEPSATSVQPTTNVDVENLPKELVVNDVRINPPCMHFDNAFDGKSYKQQMIIQNCGKRLAFIRLCEPNSSTFEFKSFPDGIYLSPGMRIIRTVRYTYKATLGVKRGFAPIWVNEDIVDYHFLVTLSCAILSIEPQFLDFGRIDAVNHATTRSFHIINAGYKGTHYAIDLGRNPLELMVDPMKGPVPAKSSVEVNVEVVGSHEGEFMEEFWVKTNPPMRVVVCGTFISPKLLVRKFINSLDFTLIDFEPTYYGSQSTQPVLIKNFSSSHSMFCVMAEIKGTLLTLEEARKIDDNYQNFIINPIDGRLAALRGAIIQMTFAPVLSRKKEKNYAAGFLKIIRMDCRDVGHDELRENFKVRTRSIMNVDTASNLITMNKEILTDEAESSYTSITFEEEMQQETFSFEHAIGVCIHGEKERAGVTLIPTAITLNDLTLEKEYHRTILVTNQSSNLPIRVRYSKVVSIDVRPRQFYLGPDDSFEVLVTIRALKLGQVTEKITFDLLSSDFPDDKHIIRKVGMAFLKVNFETTNVEKKGVLGQCVQCIPCRDLAEKLEPEYPYRLSAAEMAMKIETEKYYLDYIRSLKQPAPPENESTKDYSIGNEKLIMRENVYCQNPEPRAKKVFSYTPFIPLPPRLLFNIKITPKSIRLRKVAAFTTITDYFQIENLNVFPIRVWLQANKSCIVFDNNARHIIQSHEKKNIPFNFSTSTVGRYYVNILVLVNDSTLYEVTAVAHVVPKTLKVESNNIEFTEADGHYKFFKLINALNAYASFDWEVPKGCFKIYPSLGGIKAESDILCMVTYTPDFTQQNVNECVLTSESGQKRIVQVSYKKRKHAVVFDTYEIDVGLISLNVPIRKKLTLKNLRNFQTLYCIPHGINIPGVTIDPTEGILDGLDSQVFMINILIDAIIEWSTNIIFQVGEDKEVPIAFKGCVEFPRLSLKPDILYFRKIAPYGFDTLAFKVKNLSNVANYLTFPIEEFPEFTVTDSEDEQYPHISRVSLLPGQGKVLFLHFHPNYVSTYSLYLPYQINGILGPAHINSNATINSNYYLQEKSLIYSEVKNVSVVKKYPKLLPVARITCCAIDKTLKFSSLTINLLFFGDGHYNNMISTDFEITNTSNEVASVCIRIDDLDYPFSLAPRSDEYVEYYDVSYKIVIPPGQTVAFVAEFFPADVGEYIIKLPLFLRHYFNDKIFNYLTLRGVYDTPTITSSVDCCHFEAVPYKIANEIYITLQLSNHFEGCEIATDSDLIGLYTVFEKGRNAGVGDSQLPVIVTFECTKACCFNTKLTFHCTCNARCELTVTGVTENCLLTTHAYSHMLKSEAEPPEHVDDESVHYSERSATMYVRSQYIATLTNKNTTTYPLFPCDDDQSEYANYMRKIQKTLENWIFCQVFYMKSYYRIPEGFSDFCKVGEAREKMRFGGMKKAKLVELPFLQLMLNICGRGIRKRIPAKVPKNDDELQWLVYIYKTNSSLLYYLRGYSVYLPHVSTKLLLNYDQYVQYETAKHPERTLMEENIFYRRSKQCWIDLILQIIKTFFLFRTVEVLMYGYELDYDYSQTKFRERHSVSQVSRLSYEEEGEYVMNVGIYGEHEQELIAWLQKCWDEEKNTLWQQHTQPPELEEIVFLDVDLRDCLVLGAVTAHYCPYIRSEINDLYTRPYNPEELHHNTCVIVKTWKMLRLSYIVSPLTIQHCGMVEMLLIVNYLYAILPYYYPKETITIQAPLTQGSSASIELQNAGEDEIVYHVVFFGNENHLFSTAFEMYKLPPREKKIIKIRYHAKSVVNTTSTLVFTGETPGSKYGKTVAVNIVGEADVSYACMEIPLTVNLYQTCKVTLPIESPFKKKADYELLFGYQPVSKERNLLFQWEVIKQLKIVKEFVIPNEMTQFDEDGKCTSSPVLCCHQIGPREMWWCFTNPEVGDWSIKMTLTGKVVKECYEDIVVELPDNYKYLVCRCKPKPSVHKNCPLVRQISIPMLNNPLWNARKKMLLNYVQGEELKFWSNRIFTPTGTRIMTLILNSETHPMRQVIEETVKYKVVLQKPTCFITLRNIVIEDITSEDVYNLPIHPTKDLMAIKKCSMQLVSEDKTETRFYNIIFEHGEECVFGTESSATTE